jgi:hypothetical protein
MCENTDHSIFSCVIYGFLSVVCFSYLSIYGCTAPLLGFGRFFSFLIFLHSP